MKPIKLIALDIDGTLVPEGKTYKDMPDFTLSTLREAEDRGIKIVLCSGRMTPSVITVAKGLNLRTNIAVGYNGGSILIDNKSIGSAQLTEEQLKVIFQICRENDLYVQVYLDTEYYTHTRIEHTSHYEKKIGIKCNEIGNKLYEMKTATKCLIACRDEEHIGEVEKLFAPYRDTMLCLRTADLYFECNPLGITKGSGLRAIGQALDIALDEMMAIGDADNDMSMIDIVGCGLVMGNAKDKLKQGRTVIDTVWNEGAAKAIHEYCLSKK